ncbi:hypothetical protein PCE1_004324 [Barthelona sp. PCE]
MSILRLEGYDINNHDLAGKKTIKKLCALLASDFRFQKQFVSSLEGGHSDFFGELAAFTLHQHGLRSLAELLQQELSQTREESLALRGSGFNMRFLSVFLRIVGATYIKSLLGELIEKLILDVDYDIEIDINKVQDETMLKSNVQRFLTIGRQFLDSLFDASSIQNIPFPIRYLCCIAANAGKDICQGDTTPLICGIHILRYVSPAVTQPKKYGIVDCDIDIAARRRLILLAKVLQYIGNGIVPSDNGESETYMLTMSEFIDENISSMRRYLSRVADVPAHTLSLSEIAPDSVNWDSLLTPKHRAALQYVIVLNAIPIAVHCQQYSLFSSQVRRHRPIPHVQADREFLSIISGLGEPAYAPDLPLMQLLHSQPLELNEAFEIDMKTELNAVERSKDDWVSLRVNCIKEILWRDYRERGRKLKSGGEFIYVIKPNLDVVEDEEVHATTKRGFFGRGKAAKDLRYCNVLYITLANLTHATIQTIDNLIAHIAHHIEESNLCDANFACVIDGSFYHIEENLLDFFREQLSFLITLLPRSLTHRCEMVLLLHPTESLEKFSKPFLNALDHRMIRSVEELNDYFTSSQIRLPVESVRALTKTWNVIKINKRGKEQRRGIKLTRVSLLNLDGHSIQNEILLPQIDDIVVDEDNVTFHLHFTGNPKCVSERVHTRVDFGSIAGFFIKKGKNGVRTYRASSEEECSTIVSAITELREACPQTMRDPLNYLAFETIKINNKGKRQNRLLKLTNDSLLNIADKSIKWEKPIAGLVHFNADDISVHLGFRGDAKRWIIETPLASTLAEALRRALQREHDIQQGIMTQDSDKYVVTSTDETKTEESGAAVPFY